MKPLEQLLADAEEWYRPPDVERLVKALRLAIEQRDATMVIYEVPNYVVIKEFNEALAAVLEGE